MGQIIFTFDPFLDDFEMKEAQKSAMEAMAQGNGRIFLIDKGCVIQLIFFQGNDQVSIVLRSDRIDGRKYHGLISLKPGRGLSQGRWSECNRIADVRVRNSLHPCKDIAHPLRRELVAFFSGEQEVGPTSSLYRLPD